MKLLILFLTLGAHLHGQALYIKPRGHNTSWVNFENQTGAKGMAGQTNRGAKGYALDRLKARESRVLLNIKGPGIINRMWITFNKRTSDTFKSTIVEIFWDDEKIPAVSMPLTEFFCNPLPVMASFENCCFSNPETRSFNSFVPMPFKKSAKIILTNTSEEDLTHVFYDFNLTLMDTWASGTMYFHAIANREAPTGLGKDYTILPELHGNGRFLGVSVGVIADKRYEKTWWGEGEIKFYIDDDYASPSLSGTGVEDYIGTACGQGSYVNWYQGCPIADTEKEQWSFYRFHLPDPIYFDKNIRVTLQQMGGACYEKVRELSKKGVPLIPVTADMSKEMKFVRLLDMENTPAITDDSFPHGWVNFYRQDEVNSVAYFYLDKPSVIP